MANETTSEDIKWNGKKGPIAPSKMATPHIENAIRKVEGELAQGFDAAKDKILSILRVEHSTRSDKTAS